jgi:hypothetical protein
LRPANRKATNASQGDIKKVVPKDDLLRFSFKFFDGDDDEICPRSFPEGYVQVLMNRLRELEAWTAKEFQTKQNKTIRNHTHTWSKTARPDGFSCLPREYDAYPGWQFCLTANEYGRVHGVISGGVFYIVWLDCNHALYPEA